MTHRPGTGVLLGAYALAPAAPDAQAELYAGLIDLGIAGLELPLPAEGPLEAQVAWEARHLQPGWDLLVTCIPTVMKRLGKDAAYGLSSTDDDARAHALADVARARDLAVRLAHTHGARRVVGIQVHSAPGPLAGSRDALQRSLDEILTWDLAGAEIVLEHCDAYLPGQTAEKGFWSLADETAAVRATGAGPDRIGVGINWGRSAIEGRSAATALAHVRRAADDGVLRAVVLSGATDTETPWGPAWSDGHIAPRGTDPALALSSNSLLGPDEVRAALAVDPAHVAVKIAVRPLDADVATRLAVARAALELVSTARVGTSAA